MIPSPFSTSLKRSIILGTLKFLPRDYDKDRCMNDISGQLPHVHFLPTEGSGVVLASSPIGRSMMYAMSSFQRIIKDRLQRGWLGRLTQLMSKALGYVGL
jgi:hypothetical protein